MINFYNDGCGCRPTVKITDTGSMSTYQKLCYVLQVAEEIVELVNSFQEQLNAKENSVNITNQRKLSETGNFTGTWFNESKASVDLKLSNSLYMYENLLQFYKANPQIWVNVYEGKFFMTNEEIEKELNGGSFDDYYTNEIDCGLFIYPCICPI